MSILDVSASAPKPISMIFILKSFRNTVVSCFAHWTPIYILGIPTQFLRNVSTRIVLSTGNIAEFGRRAAQESTNLQL